MKQQPKKKPAKEKKVDVKTDQPTTSNRKYILLLAALSLILYSNTLNHGYVYDDFSVLKENTIVTQGISAIPEILSTPYRKGFFSTSNDMYRPLSLVMFATEYQLFGDDPHVSHLLNILIYAGCVIVLFIFLNLLFDRKKTAIAFVASLIFAVHPIHTEVVANIKSRDELLCFFFAFSSLITFLRYYATAKSQYLLYGTVLLFLSLLSKETSVTWIVIVPIIFFLYKNEDKKKSVFITISTIAPILLFLTLRFSILNRYNAGSISDVEFIDNFLIGASAISTRIATSVLILGKYLTLLFFPYPLISDYSYNSIPLVSFSNLWVIISTLTYLSLTAVVCYRLFKYKKDIPTLGILIYLISISLFSNILFLTGAAMAERFLFFGSAGFALIIAYLIVEIAKKMSGEIHVADSLNTKVLTIIIPVCMLLAVATVNRNSSWKDNITLFSTDVKKAPENARLNYYYGNEILVEYRSGNTMTQSTSINDAMDYLKKAVNIYPGYSDAHLTIGNGYFMLKAYDSAEKHLKKAIGLRPGYINAWNNLDVIYYTQGKYQRSIEACKKVIELDRNSIRKYKNIATCFLQLHQPDSAIHYLNMGILAKPTYLPFYKDIALAFKMNNTEDSAKKYERLVQKSEPGFMIY